MAVGRTFEGELRSYVDATSGREIVQLTDYLGHSYQFYFTEPCWLDGGRSLVFVSHRENRSNFYRCDLDTGLITQLTDASTRKHASGCLSPATGCLYYWSDASLHELNASTLDDRVVCRKPESIAAGRPSAGADGRYVWVLLRDGGEEDGPRRPARDGGSRSLFEHPRRIQIVRIDVKTGCQETLFEDVRYISHLNPSPVHPKLLTFCHEGPWEEVKQRIWGLNANTGEVWPIRPQNGDFSVVAEHWLADGERIGFRSHRSGTDGTRFGHIRFDNEDHVEADLTAYSRHFHTQDGQLVVGDGSPVYRLPTIVNRCATWPYILLYPWTGQAYGAPKILANHGSTFNVNEAHCHPHITPDGRHVLYTSDTSGYGNLYLVEIGDLSDLPELNLDRT